MRKEENYVTVLGVGNILLGDEGFGVHFVRRLARRYTFPPHVRILDGGVLAYTLLDIICSSKRLIVVDVIKLDDNPGSIYRFSRAEMETLLPPPTSAHEVTFADVLFKAELLGELGEVIFLCIVPGCCHEMSMEMTPVMVGKMDAMEGFLMKELDRLGISGWRTADA